MQQLMKKYTYSIYVSDGQSIELFTWGYIFA
jgi:hypothetical protein